MTSELLIDLHHLTRRYGPVVALDDVTLQVATGRIGLLGPNGAGKSTLLKLVMGMLAPTSGTGTVLGHALGNGDDCSLRRSIGFMPEADALVPGLSGVEYVSLAGELYGLPRRQAQRRAHEVLTYLELEDARYRKVEEYSTGMKQRVKLAQALVHDPPVLLLDEPTSGLDPQTARLVRDLVLGLRDDGHTIVISTHNLDEAERVATRIGVLQRRLIAVDTPNALRSRLFGQRVRFVLADPQTLAPIALRAGARDLQMTDDGFSIALEHPACDVPCLVRTLVAAGAELHAVIPEQAPLEDVYLTLLERDENGSGK
jgi:ABC-type multidrug transport system ATPase subunit